MNRPENSGGFFYRLRPAWPEIQFRFEQPDYRLSKSVIVGATHCTDRRLPAAGINAPTADSGRKNRISLPAEG